MNDNKYKVSGKTHKNGTLATSRQTWFVVARSSIEGTMARTNHKVLRFAVGDSPASSKNAASSENGGPSHLMAIGDDRRAWATAHAVQRTANSAKAADHRPA